MYYSMSMVFVELFLKNLFHKNHKVQIVNNYSRIALRLIEIHLFWKILKSSIRIFLKSKKMLDLLLLYFCVCSEVIRSRNFVGWKIYYL